MTGEPESPSESDPSVWRRLEAQQRRRDTTTWPYLAAWVGAGLTGLVLSDLLGGPTWAWFASGALAVVLVHAVLVLMMTLAELPRCCSLKVPTLSVVEVSA